MNEGASIQAVMQTHRVLSACLIMGEPKLEDLLSDPIVLLRMKRAGVSVQELRALCQSVRARLAAEAFKP